MTNIYISHGFHDVKIAQDISSRLKAKGYNVALDVDILTPGQEWRATLWSALENSDTVVAIFSDKSLSAQYVMFEVGAARALKKNLIPLVVGELPIPLVVQDILCIRISESEIEEAVNQINQVITP